MSKVIFKKFNSIEEIKSNAEFIPKGRIYPARIVKCSKRKFQHCMSARSNQYAIPTKSGYLIFVDNNDGHFENVATIRRADNRLGISYGTKSKLNEGAGYIGSPYNLGGTMWQGDHETSEEDFLNIFNEKYLSMNLGV